MLIKFYVELGNNVKRVVLLLWIFEGYIGVFDILRNFWEILLYILSVFFINF